MEPVSSLDAESRPYFTYTGRWVWDYDYTDEQIKVEGYEDRLIKQEVLKYSNVGTQDTPNYIIDLAEPTYKNYYNRIEKRSGRFTVSGLTWAPVYSLPLRVTETWSNCLTTWVIPYFTTGGPERPIREWGISYPQKYYNFPADDGTCPVEVPPNRPAGAPPFAVLQCEVVVKSWTKIEPGEVQQWLFGGRPSRNLFSATRGQNAIIAVDTLAQGDPRVPPALNKVTQVIIRIPNIPGSPQAKAALIEGNPQKGRWLTSLPIDPRTRVAKYKVVFEIIGVNYWGQPRRKVVEGQIWIDGGDCPATDRSCQRNPGEVSYCGLSEEQMRALGDRWIYKCNDPRLIK